LKNYSIAPQGLKGKKERTRIDIPGGLCFNSYRLKRRELEFKGFFCMNYFEDNPIEPAEVAAGTEGVLLPARQANEIPWP
jgi:hypothetical protein